MNKSGRYMAARCSMFFNHPISSRRCPELLETPMKKRFDISLCPIFESYWLVFGSKSYIHNINVISGNLYI